MKIELSDDRDLSSQATRAGFATVEDYVQNLIDRDTERLAIQVGIHAKNENRSRPFSEFDEEFRRDNDLPHFSIHTSEAELRNDVTPDKG